MLVFPQLKRLCGGRLWFRLIKGPYLAWIALPLARLARLLCSESQLLGKMFATDEVPRLLPVVISVPPSNAGIQLHRAIIDNADRMIAVLAMPLDCKPWHFTVYPPTLFIVLTFTHAAFPLSLSPLPLTHSITPHTA